MEMNVNYQELIRYYRDNGIALEVDQGKLKYQGKKGVLTSEQLEFLKIHRQGLIDALSSDTEREEFPLTDIQSAYLLGRMESFSYGGVNCQIYLELDYDELDVIKANRAFRELIRKHEMLRAVILENGNQMIREKLPGYQLLYQEYAGPASYNTDEIKAVREQYGQWKSKIGEWPFFNIGITKFEDKSILHICLDFLIVDWTSIWILICEFEQLYFRPEDFKSTVGLTFREYLRLEDELKKDKRYKADKKYWTDRIADFPGCPQIPVLDRSELKNSFCRKIFELDAGGWEAFKTKAQRYNCTPTAAVITAYGLCLARWSETAAFALNLTMLNRLPLHQEVHEIVGDFTTVNLLQMLADNTVSFADNMKRVQNQMSCDLDHITYSGVKVLREITRQTGQDAAFYPYVFTGSIGLVDDSSRIGKMGGYSISQTPQVFIDCQAMDSRDGLRVNWDIRDGVFKEELIAAVFQTFQQVMNELAENDEKWESCELIPLPSNQLKVRAEVNNTAAGIPFAPLHDGFVKNITSRPEATAVIDELGECSYRELGILAANIAGALSGEGCQKGDKIGILIKDGRFQIAAVLAVLSRGAVYVPLDDKQPQVRINKIMESVSARLVITSVTFADRDFGELTRITADRLCESRKDDPDSWETVSVGPDDLAYIIFTSGSTGMPKGVQITHKAANNTIIDINSRFGVSSKDKVLSLSRLNFDLSVYDIFGLLTAGGTIVFANNDQYINPQHWYELLEKHHITIWNTVPSTMHLLLDHLETIAAGSLSLALVLVSGDWIPVSMRKRLAAYNSSLKMVGLGGATEASIWSNYHICNEADDSRESIPYGYPLANQEYRILNDRMEMCPDYVIGELFIIGDGLSRGYANDEEMNRKHFIVSRQDGKKMYRTGDYGYYTAAGEIIFCGRKDTQVKVRGHRIELGEIESCLMKMPQIRECCVIINSHKKNNRHQTAETAPAVNQIIGAAVPKTNITEDEVIQYLQGQLPEYMIPVHISLMEQMPLTNNGKIDRQAIREEYAELMIEAKQEENIPAATELEKMLIQNMERHLGMTGLPSDGNTYNYGADSLVMARYIGDIKDSLNGMYPDIDFSYDRLLRQILNCPVIKDLHDFICEYIKEEQKSDVTAAKQKRLGLFTRHGEEVSGPARIVFHAGLGTMNCFRFFLPGMIEQQLGTVYGVTIQDMDRYCQVPAEELMEKLGEEYAQQIQELGFKEVQLIGYCMGGLIALEVARNLAGADVEIKDFVLVDSAPVNHDIGELLALELIFITNYFITVEQVYNEITNEELINAIQYVFQSSGDSLSQDDFALLADCMEHRKAHQFFQRLEKETQEERFKDYAATIKREIGEEVPVEMLLTTYKIYIQSFKASKIDADPYFGNIRFLEASEAMDFIFTNGEENRQYWVERCIGDLEVIPIPGNHISCMEDSDNAAIVAEWARKGLDGSNA